MIPIDQKHRGVGRSHPWCQRIHKTADSRELPADLGAIIMSTDPAALCQHMKLNGTRCGSPALRNRKFCYFHERYCPVKVDVSTSAAFPAAPFFLPVLEDASSIQLAISQVCEHMLHRRLDTKKASVMLYALQVASSNLARMNREKIQENNQQNKQESAPASSEASATAQDDSGSTASSDPNRLPPGTIQACEQPRRFAV